MWPNGSQGRQIIKPPSWQVLFCDSIFWLVDAGVVSCNETDRMLEAS